MIRYSTYATQYITLRTPSSEVIENRIVVSAPNTYYQAFPNGLVEAPNGNFIVAYSKGNVHSVSYPFKIMLRTSTDKGKTWGNEVLFHSFYTDEGGTDGTCDFVICRVDNRIFLLMGGYAHVGATLPRFNKFKYSDDSGATWSAEVNFTSAHFNNWCDPHNKIIKTPNGDYLMPVWGNYGTDYNTTVKAQAGVLKSSDQGMTWADLSLVANVDDWYSEPVLVYAPNGKLLFFIRSEVLRQGILYTSLDNGETWDSGVLQSFNLGSPKFLVDGNDLYLFGRRFWGSGIHYMMDLVYLKSTDSGITWSSETTVDYYGGDFTEGQGGYCAPILYDNKIGLVYFTNDGYDNILGVLSDNQPYIKFIEDIKADANFGNLLMTNLRINYSYFPFEVWEKIGSGNYSLIGISDGVHNHFNHLVNTNLNYTHKCRCTVGGMSFSNETTQLFVHDARAEKIFKNIVAQGETITSARKLNIHNTIVALRAANLFDTQFDALWIHRNTGAKTSKMNLIKDSFNCIGVANEGTLTFTPDLGYSSDGVKSYIDLRVRNTITTIFKKRGTGIDDDSCYGFKLSGTLPNTGSHFYGTYWGGVYAATYLGSNDSDNYAGLSGTLKTIQGVKRVIGYNNLSRNSYTTFKQMSNADVLDINTNSNAGYSRYLFSLALNNDTVAESFEDSGVVVEIEWVGKYLSPENFLVFQGIMNNYIANL